MSMSDIHYHLKLIFFHIFIFVKKKFYELTIIDMNSSKL